MHAQPLSPRPTSPAVRSMGVDHSPSATVSPTADGNCAAHATVRPGSGERDAFYLVHLWSRWFGAEYERGHRYSSGDSRCRSVRSPGGRSTTPPASTCTPSSPSTTRLIETARSISAVDSRRSSHASKPSRSCPTAGSTPTRSRAIAMRGSGSVSSTTRGAGSGSVAGCSRNACSGLATRVPTWRSRSVGNTRPDESPAVRGLRVRPCGAFQATVRGRARRVPCL